MKNTAFLLAAGLLPCLSALANTTNVPAPAALPHPACVCSNQPSMVEADGKLLDENNPDDLRGAAVDPDLIELRSGILVAAFGVRIPQKACWKNPRHPWNGNDLAFSQDGGQTWPNVIRMTSGVLTTHYMAIEETLTDNRIFVAYDLGGWSKGMNRDVVGRFVEVTPNPR